MKTRLHGTNHYIFLTFAAVGLFFNGCAFFGHGRDMAGPVHELKIGYELFHKANYEEAASRFEAAFHQGTDWQIRREALYNLAWTRMVLAEKPDQYENALKLWDTWHKLSLSSAGTEDPKMCDPFLKKFAMSKGLSPKIVDENHKDAGDKPVVLQNGSAVSEMAVRDLIKGKEITGPDRENSDFSPEEIKNLLDKKNGEIRKLKAKERKYIKEINMLKSQLKSVEEIHQEMMRKKKDVSP